MKSGEGRCGGNFLDRAGMLEIACNVLKGPDQPAKMRLCSNGSHGCIIAWNPASGLTECAYFQIPRGRRSGLLKVSPMHLVRLPDGDRIPGRKAGAHHCVRVRDILDRRRGMEFHNRMALDELTDVDQDLGLQNGQPPNCR